MKEASKLVLFLSKKQQNTHVLIVYAHSQTFPLYQQFNFMMRPRRLCSGGSIKNVTTGSKEKDNQAGLNSQPRSSVTTQNHKTTTAMKMYNMKMTITCHMLWFSLSNLQHLSYLRRFAYLDLIYWLPDQSPPPYRMTSAFPLRHVFTTWSQNHVFRLRLVVYK